MNARKPDPRRAVRHVLNTLHEGGHRALLAGGCVRDKLLGRPPKDYDVVTDAVPDRVLALFPRARHVGAQFGVIIVRKYGCDIEVATFRSDGAYTDGRHPVSVTFGTETEDARRRDFTINALFYDPDADRVIDHVHGREDLEAKIIRTVGDPVDRFREDHLRMLRAVRFAARLDFNIAPETLEAIKRGCKDIGLISPERIWMELQEILVDSSRARGWRLLVETELVNHLTQRLWVDVESAGAIGARLERLPPDPLAAQVGLAAILADHTMEDITHICRALRLSNRLSDATAWLIASLSGLLEGATLELADVKALMARDDWEHLLLLYRAELERQSGETEAWERLRRRAERIPKEAVTPPPLLDGAGLAQLGVTPGPDFGSILKQVYRAQRNETIKTQQGAVELARSILARMTPKG